MLDPKIKVDVDLISKLSIKNLTEGNKKMVLLIDELESSNGNTPVTKITASGQ